MRLYALSLLSLIAVTAVAQENTPVPTTTNPGGTNPLGFAGELLEHNTFNFFAYADGVYDSYAPILQANGQTTNNGAFGYSVGGGVNGTHQWQTASISLMYSGDYRDYPNSSLLSGSDQNLAFGFNKRLGRRLSMYIAESAGILLYGGVYYSLLPNEATATVIPNSFSSETRFMGSSIGFTYQQTRRLSYSVGGSFFLDRYNYVGAVGITGASGYASANYRLTALTSVGASYGYSYFAYQGNAGNAKVNSLSGFVVHEFKSHWTVSGSGGFTRSDVTGTAALPASLVFGAAGPGGYLLGQFKQVATFPSFAGTVSHYYRRLAVSASAGQGIIAGNGYFLASKSQFVNGAVTRSFRRSNLTAAATYSRLSSVANNVSASYSSGALSIAYGVSLMRYVGANGSYSFIHYGYLSPVSGINDNRLAFGITFSSRRMPITLY